MATTDEGHIRDALERIHRTLIEMVEYYPTVGGNEHKARWERQLRQAHEHILAIRVRGDAARKAKEHTNDGQ